ncbi:MAG: NAD(P)H-dependent glycerol-3-phosphate dehydrogenase [Candidatus Paracaedibacteraceae bacterium]|nr:NAD(P)H-dependent glycerol-3-phosphate dehydrogenase [Candidatus Paracaedibacteraceae bacterium]
MKKIVVIGAGGFGTALALTFLKAGHNVTLKPRREEHAAEMRSAGENQQYLKGISFPKELMIDADPKCLKLADIVVVATPVQRTPEILNEYKNVLPHEVPLIIASKGILTTDPFNTPFISSWLKKHMPSHPVYVLSGPNFASEIARGLPAAATLAHFDTMAAKEMAITLWHEHFRIYPSIDQLGVEFCGAVKNVYAIACGICVGLNLGQNALATLVTRGLAEIKRLGIRQGAHADTFLGLSGVGDLMLTCTSTQSRNMTLGIELAKGRSVADIMAERHTIAEGVATSKALHDLVKKSDISMPIAAAVYQIVHENESVKDVISGLLSRHEVRFEGT